ncbi:MAG: thermonuclease family protein [Planctomycetes bacterium]|nr:thermonuclease family protein [Planctomycetota bacterium]
MTKSKFASWGTLLAAALPFAAVVFVLPFMFTDSVNRVEVGAADLTVVDGDTLEWGGERCKLAGIDAPEVARPERWDGDQEPWATRATELLRAEIAKADTIEIAEGPNRDESGVKLIQLYVDGVPVGVRMIEGGLAYANVDRVGDSGFPDDSRAIRQAFLIAGHPEFQDPHTWRQAHAIEPGKD